jgi:Domain of unknown function (DUF5666)
MELFQKGRPRRLRLMVVFASIGLGTSCGVNAGKVEGAQQAAQQPAPNAARPRGTIKTVTGNTILLTTDAGGEVTIQVRANAKLVRIEPGEKDLKNAAPLQLEDLQPGDRILVGGTMADDGKTVLAASLIAMKHTDIAAKQEHEREEWRKNGVGGLVTAIDAASGAIKISTSAQGPAKEVTVQFSKQTILRRYSSDSVKFDDAKTAPIDQIKVGDQLRARGTRSQDGTQLTADEVVSGTFRNIAGTVSAIDAAAGTITVMDLITKRAVTVKIGADSQLRKLPPMMAQIIAMRLKGASAEGAAAGNGTASATPKATEATAGGGAGGQFRGAGGAGRPGGGGGGDFQQMLSRLPAQTLADLQKGDAVMIVTTEGTEANGVTAITLLAGVEQILQASPAGGGSAILTPWTLGTAPPTGDTTP